MPSSIGRLHTFQSHGAVTLPWRSLSQWLLSMILLCGVAQAVPERPRSRSPVVLRENPRATGASSSSSSNNPVPPTRPSPPAPGLRQQAMEVVLRRAPPGPNYGSGPELPPLDPAGEFCKNCRCLINGEVGWFWAGEINRHRGWYCKKRP